MFKLVPSLAAALVVLVTAGSAALAADSTGKTRPPSPPVAEVKSVCLGPYCYVTPAIDGCLYRGMVFSEGSVINMKAAEQKRECKTRMTEVDNASKIFIKSYYWQ
ncbi:hypothetical protein ACTL6U_15460 [Rhodovibrionaceae bacterium A322]